MIILQSPRLAANYSTEFAKMFEKKQFGPTKDKALPNPTVTIGGTRIQTCFAAEEAWRDADHRRRSRGASSQINFMAFSFTSDRHGGDAARQKAGVRASGRLRDDRLATPTSANTAS